MLKKIKEIKGYKTRTRDGQIGKAKDFYFDDRTWTIRYMILDTGSWLTGRKVLISPVSVGKPDWERKIIPVNLSKEQIQCSPLIDEEKPVSKQHERKLINYFYWPNYWETFGQKFLNSDDTETGKSTQITGNSNQEAENINPHLRSCEEVLGYTIQALNGEIGHVEDYIAEDGSWIIRYLVVDTANFFPWSKKVLVAPCWIKRVKWPEKKVHIDLTKEVIQNSPDFDLSKPVERDNEDLLYGYYGRPGYWKKSERRE